MTANNSFTCVGNVANPKFEDGRLTFSVAIDDGYWDAKANHGNGEWVERTVFAPFVAWGKSAEALKNRVTKGSLVSVEGVFKTWSSGEGEDRRSGNNFQVVNVKVLRRKGNSGASQAQDEDMGGIDDGEGEPW